ncbi:hypothetical protein RO3G_11002 [Rhizopus delemar RA 99-880]|uniref:Uncharacterized protein n=1 Tax=Rhizopus delemar (strain RA 99-880 / ATCC MYA-4621 / FGSC 9543 / NRRL 43880) TaxID=246409 RepID=I1CCW1_RHIO9|nr:hypothetical protein RO3G_11002 [Rhizopus delemar RA 99-880]|eukprot:EIE86291.1 hypothetical protein RO3G_11002 [Rhizopus delemar RA 99-880]
MFTTSNTEFAKKESESKYYKDLLKAVPSSKIHINELLKNFPDMSQEIVKELKMPLCVVTGTTCYVYDLYLESLNFYLVEDACNTKAMVDEKDGLL